MNPDLFVRELHKKGIMLNDRQIKQFDIYFHTLVEWNAKMNLTAITEQNDVYLKHFYDSISVALYCDFTKEVHICDVGAGAGFPSIPLKICFPHIHVTIVDSLQKRIGFLNQLVTNLDIGHVTFYHDRAESFGKNKEFRESYDIVMARAVARMSVLSELCLPLTKKNGKFIAMKATQTVDELKDAEAAISILGGRMNTVHTFTLPEEDSERSIIIVDKQGETPNKYPRKAGVPNKNPIIKC